MCLALCPAVLLADGATSHAWGASSLEGIPAADSLVAAEFAKDSTGSLTVGVIAGSRLVWTRSVGFADMKTRRPANRATLYRIGSITKPFTALMLMQAVAAGRVSLSDPVERHLPEVRRIRARPRGAAPFTFLQLATMTAGLSREPDDNGPFWTGPVASWEQTLLAALPHVSYRSTPGTEYSYSNVGYAILGAALARVVGKPYVEWERLHVLQPLGMLRTRFELDPASKADLAAGYEVEEDGTLDDETPAKEIRDGRGYKVPNGALFTTVDDLARFVSFELGCGPDSVLARPLLTDAFDGLVATDLGLERGYGLGFMAMRRGEYAFVGHNGGVPGYRAAMYYDREVQLGVVVLSNVGGGKQDPDRLAIDILATLASKKTSEIKADRDRRVEQQVPSPGSEPAIRHLITRLRLGEPAHSLMNFTLSREARGQLAHTLATMSRLGELHSVDFSRVGRSGPDIYEAAFEKGVLEWRIWMNLDGSVDSFFVRELPQPSK